jgi:hypothetical protein
VIGKNQETFTCNKYYPKVIHFYNKPVRAIFATISLLVNYNRKEKTPCKGAFLEYPILSKGDVGSNPPRSVLVGDSSLLGTTTDKKSPLYEGVGGVPDGGRTHNSLIHS